MEKISLWWNKYKDFMVGPAITVLILLVIYAIKGIYPFGTTTIANGDMGQSYMTFYHFLYDIFHQGKSVFYDYTLGMGSNMYGGFMSDGLLNPSTFIILLSNRENIPYLFSFVLMIKVAFIAFTSYLLFHKLYQNNTFYNILFSVLYALSGYVIMYHTNLMWLDVVGLFPLFIMAIKHMFETDKIYWYAIILALMLIFNYNLAYMVLMFIIFVIPVYIKFGMEKEKRKKAVFNVLIGTVLSVGLSAFSFIPSFWQVMSSYRMAGTTVNTVENVNVLFKIVVFVFYSLPLYGVIQWIQYRKQDKKQMLIYGLAFLFSAILPIVFERINLLWHTGSYQMFPFRYGFIPVLILFLASLSYFSNYEKEEKRDNSKWNMVKLIIGILFVFAISIAIYNAIAINQSMPAFNLLNSNFYLIVLTCFMMIGVVRGISYLEREKTRKVLLSLVVIVEVCMYAYAYIGVDEKDRYGREWSDDAIFASYQIQQQSQIQESFYKIKDLTGTTTENCPLVYQIPSMSTFLHFISKEQVVTCEQLGYSHNRTKINDWGGTLFSDALYGIKYVLTKKELPSEIYQYVKEIGNGNQLYETKNVLPKGILYNHDETIIPEELKLFDAQNYVYQKLFHKNEDIIKTMNSIKNKEDLQVQKTEQGFRYILEIQDANELYLACNTQNPIEKIRVNQKEVVIPIINDEENTRYPNLYTNGILDLGLYQNETIKIELEGQINEKEIEFGLLNLETYNQLFTENQNEIQVEIKADTITITGNCPKDTNLFLPINYDKGWNVTKDTNQEVEIKKVYGNFIGLTMKQGDNQITLQFRPYLYQLSVSVTIITIIAMIMIYIVRKKLDIRNAKGIMNVFWLLGIVIYLGCFLKIYVISIIQTLIVSNTSMI